MLHAVILYSVGSPETLTLPSLRRYLNRFLSDKWVIQLPSFLWQPILHSFILRTRPHRLIKRYEQIFVDGHNPYLIAMDKLCVKLEQYLNERQELQNITTTAAQDALRLSQESLFSANTESAKAANATVTAAAGVNGDAATAKSAEPDAEAKSWRFMVRPCYAYCGEGLEQAIDHCLQCGATQITVVQLFPQYSLSTSKAAELTLLALQRQGLKAQLNFVRSYATEPLYIEALANNLRQCLDLTIETDLNAYLQQHHAHIVLTYHGLPQSYIKDGEPYVDECKATTSALMAALHLKAEHCSVAYQSKMGPMPWLQPYLEDTVEQLLKEHVQHLIVLSPTFTLDCLETLYDINIKLRELFLSKGGEKFTYVPALNDNAGHVTLLSQLVATAPALG